MRHIVALQYCENCARFTLLTVNEVSLVKHPSASAIGTKWVFIIANCLPRSCCWNEKIVLPWSCRWPTIAGTKAKVVLHYFQPESSPSEPCLQITR